MTDIRNSKKRKTGDLKDEGNPDQYQRGDFWFDDGNIVLVAGKTAFRAHQGVLSRKSEVFKDMVAVPQPQNPSTYDGCPTVELSEDEEDVKLLLSSIYDGDRCVIATTAELLL